MNSQDAVIMMSKFVNNMCFDSREFVEGMGNEHRTLQQTFTELCFEWIRYNADNYDKGIFDGRNEYSCRKCKEIATTVDLFKCPFV